MLMATEIFNIFEIFEACIAAGEIRLWGGDSRNGLKFDYFDYICAPKTKQ